jgi:hypothetical protein
MISPTPGVGCETVAPHEQRKFNGSALSVVDIQDSLHILIRLCVRELRHRRRHYQKYGHEQNQNYFFRYFFIHN